MTIATLSLLYAVPSLAATAGALALVLRHRDRRFLNPVRAALLAAGATVLVLGTWTLPKLVTLTHGSDWLMLLPISQMIFLLSLTYSAVRMEWMMRKRDGVARAQWRLFGQMLAIEVPSLLVGLAVGCTLPLLTRLAPRWSTFTQAPATLLAVALGLLTWSLLRPRLIRRVFAAYRPGVSEMFEEAFERHRVRAPQILEIPVEAGPDVRAASWSLFSRHAGVNTSLAFFTAEVMHALDPREAEALAAREVAHAYLKTTRRRFMRLLAAAETLTLASLLYPTIEIPIALGFGLDSRTVQFWIPFFAIALAAAGWLRREVRLVHDEEKTADLFAVNALGAEAAWLIGGLRKLLAGSPAGERVLALRLAALERGLEPAALLPQHDQADDDEDGWRWDRLKIAGAVGGAFAVALLVLFVTPVGKRMVLQTRLAFAIRSHDANRLEALLKAGANPNHENLFGISPVSAAAGSGDLVLLQSLLDNGGAVHNESWPNQPLHAAAARGRKAIVSLLLEKGAPINAVDFFGRTPLWVAAANGQTEVVALLLQHGARTLSRDGSGLTAQQIAERRGYREIARALKRGAASKKTAETAAN